MRLVARLWHEVTNPVTTPGQLEADVRAAGMGWALPTTPDHLDDDDWLTPDQIAHETGYEATTVRVWAHRYQLTQVKGTYRWGDVRQMLRQRTHPNRNNRR